jgi:hypothetical protein
MITMRLHPDPNRSETWVDSPDVPGYTAIATTPSKAMKLVRQARDEGLLGPDPDVRWVWCSAEHLVVAVTAPYISIRPWCRCGADRP